MPIDVSKRHISYDIKSTGRLIEVKSRTGGKLQPFIFIHNPV